MSCTTRSEQPGSAQRKWRRTAAGFRKPHTGFTITCKNARLYHAPDAPTSSCVAGSSNLRTMHLCTPGCGSGGAEFRRTGGPWVSICCITSLVNRVIFSVPTLGILGLLLTVLPSPLNSNHAHSCTSSHTVLNLQLPLTSPV